MIKTDELITKMCDGHLLKRFFNAEVFEREMDDTLHMLENLVEELNLKIQSVKFDELREQDDINNQILVSKIEQASKKALENSLETQRLIQNASSNIQDLITNKSIEVEDLEDEAFAHGGGSDIFKGIYKKKVVAVKRTRCDTMTLSALKALGRELYFLKRASLSPGIVNAFGVFEVKGVTSLVMEFVDGLHLSELCYDTTVQITWANRMKMCQQISSGVNYLHEVGIVHKDLRSRNVLVVKSSFLLKIIDFDLGSNVQTVALGEQGGNVGVTLSDLIPWIEPNVLFKGKLFSTKSDIYSVGTLFWEICFRTKPCEYIPLKNLKRHFETNDLPDAVPKRFLPEGLGSLIKRCWLQNEEERPSSTELEKSLFNIMSYKRDVGDFNLKKDVKVISQFGKREVYVIFTSLYDPENPVSVSNLKIVKKNIKW
jgi:serine/threonine protein kinase